VSASQRLVAAWPAVPLVALAGCVDAIGYLRLQDIFVSFMSGTSTLLGLALAGAEAARAAKLATVLGLFACGALLGAAAGRMAGPRWQATAVLTLVAALLAAAWQAPLLVGGGGMLAPEAWPMVPAMGALNTALPGVGGITFVTGALTRFAAGLVDALLGRAAHAAWLEQLAAWAALVAGAVGGAALELRWGTEALAAPPIGAAFAAAVALSVALRRG